jgi:hypothetical protein
MLYYSILALFSRKKIVATPEKSKWRRECLYFSPNICNNDIFVFCFSIIWVTNKTFMEKLFLENSKWQNNLI